MAYEEENKYSRLEELSGSDFQIVEGEPDIIGREVIDAQGRTIGEVDDVLFDPNTRDVRYMVVDLSSNELDIDVDKRVLIPIGLAELPDQFDDEDELEEDDETTVIATDSTTGDVNEYIVEDDEVEEYNDEEEDEDEVDEVVYLPTVTVEHLLAIPEYDKDHLSPEYETSIRNIFQKPDNDTIVAYHQDTFYTHDHFNNKIYPRTGEASDELDRSDLDADRRSDDYPNKNIL